MYFYKSDLKSAHLRVPRIFSSQTSGISELFIDITNSVNIYRRFNLHQSGLFISPLCKFGHAI